MKKNIGKEFLFSDEYDYSQIGEGNGYRYSDGSAYYDGDDGTEIHIYSDGSGYFEGADGSEGHRYSDGSGYFEGADGSKGYKYSDGTGYFEDKNGNPEYFDYDSHDENYDIENDLAYKAGKALGIGLVGFISGIATSSTNLYKNNLIKDSEDNYEEDDEGCIEYEDDEIQEEEDYEIKNESATHKKEEEKWWFMYFGFTIVILVIFYLILFWNSMPKKGEIKISINAKDYIGVQYTEVEEKFINMGFSNIKSVPKEDLILGWFNKEGATAKITISNNDDFKKDEIFPKDADVIIYYHSFKKK